MSRKKICGVYKITCVPSGKVYVGSSADIDCRWRQHRSILRLNKSHNPYFQRAWSKYGECSFTFEVLEITDPEGRIEREEYWISALCSADRKFGYNLNLKPSGIGAISEETRAKLAAAKRKPEELERLIRRNKEPWTPERRARSMGRAVSDETREKIASKLRGTSLSADHRKKVSDGLMGRIVDNETRLKIGTANARKKYVAISPDRISYEVSNLQEFCRLHELNASNLCNVAKGKRPHHKGWTCRYADETQAA